MYWCQEKYLRFGIRAGEILKHKKYAMNCYVLHKGIAFASRQISSAKAWYLVRRRFFGPHREKRIHALKLSSTCKPASKAVLGRMQLNLHATRQTPHGDSRLVQAMPTWSVKPLHAPSRHCTWGCEGLWPYDYAHACTPLLPPRPIPSTRSYICPILRRPLLVVWSHSGQPAPPPRWCAPSILSRK